MIVYLGTIDSNDVIHSCFPWDDGSDGPSPIHQLDEPPVGLVHTELPRELVWDHPSPTAVAKLVNGDIAWVETAPIDILKARKNSEIDAARESANRTYFVFSNLRIACTDLSWKDIMSTSAFVSLAGRMPNNWPGFWKSMDKDKDGVALYAPVPDVATWINFVEAMVDRGNAHFAKSQNLKTTLSAATTPEDISAIMW